MEFLKNNWSKIVLAAVSFAGAIMMIVPLFMAPEINFISASQVLGFLLFFVGAVAVLVLSMFENLKLYKAITLAVTGLLVITFMSVGLAGFTEKSKDAEGAMGNAYAYFKTRETEAKASKVDYDNLVKAIAMCETPGEKKLSDLTALVPKVAATVAALPGGDTLIAADPALSALSAATGGQLSPAIIKVGLDAEKVTADALVKAMGFKNLDDAAQSANTASTTLMLVYISMILALGALPLVAGGKKIVCHFCKCENC